MLMKLKLKARALWNVIENGGADAQEEMMALEALCDAVPPEMVPTIAKKEMAKEAWDAIATMRIGDDRVKRSMAQQLRRRFDLTTFSDGETVKDYALRLESMAVHINTLGEELKDLEIVANILRSVPPRFKQITIAIKTLLDVSTMSVADLTGWLKEAEEAFEEAPASLQHDGKLYLTEEEWNSRRKKREEEHGGGASSGSTRCGGVCGRREGGGPPSGSSTTNRPTGDECRHCGKMGHWARECRSKPKKEQAHITQDKEEASLWLVTASPTLSPVVDVHACDDSTLQEAGREHGVGGSRAASTGSVAQFEIREEKVFAHLREEKDREAET
ncbi:hypothetical protein PR202_gb00745 [Eleusine coracana subsp. coracana]|uniref:CCHC-type domain-containing protein n=1 Tax=Eleusine coracana subsp. coracana TaxID=191504 RepID=A0AAV5DV29_ELECO|nr:hypothetical protein PR202_gb00745 [Eleusine coracana subsp. coracana]